MPQPKRSFKSDIQDMSFRKFSSFAFQAKATDRNHAQWSLKREVPSSRACYFSEIYRGGIEAVPKGQTEAGQVLGMTKSQIFFRVTLLQVIKRILAPMGNEVMTLIKDTSLANVIANKEIIMMAKEYSAKGLIWPLFSTALFFLVFVGALTILFNWAEKKLDYFRC